MQENMTDIFTNVIPLQRPLKSLYCCRYYGHKPQFKTTISKDVHAATMSITKLTSNRFLHSLLFFSLLVGVIQTCYQLNHDFAAEILVQTSVEFPLYPTL
jgi:hypothetical protein